MQRIVKTDLNLIPYKKVKVQLLLNATKAKRLTRSKVLSDEVRCDMKLPILFTDEKLFAIQSAHKTQNDQILAKNKRDMLWKTGLCLGGRNPSPSWSGLG